MRTSTSSRRRARDGSELRQLLADRRRRQRASGHRLPSAPSSFEAVTRQMVDGLGRELRDVKQRVNQLLSVIIGAIVLEVLSRLIGT